METIDNHVNVTEWGQGPRVVLVHGGTLHLSDAAGNARHVRAVHQIHPPTTQPENPSRADAVTKPKHGRVVGCESLTVRSAPR